MTKARSIRALSLVLLTMAGACTQAASAALPAGDPYVRGTVQTVQPNAAGARVAVLSGGGCGLDGNTSADTHYLKRTPDGGVEAARLVDVRAGSSVAVWVTGPVTRSCPPIARISAIIIEPA
jgi:hypothetical protein